MLWNLDLNVEEIKDLQQKDALMLGHYMKRYSRGKSGQWQKIHHTRIFLDNEQQYELFLVGSKKSTDEEGVFYLKNSGQKFLINGRPSYGCFVFNGDRIVINQEIFDFKKLTDNLEYVDSVPLSHNMIYSDDIVLLQGETGTGKGYIAEKIMTLRKPLRPWVHINLAALAPSLIESEIFGHVKGAFTGACYEHRGAIKSANGSILFLDEIDSLPLELQTKLLLFLDNYRLRSVGSMREEKVSLKLIVASGRPLEILVDKGIFRKDLYYRLNGGHMIRLPSLYKRGDLIESFCRNYAMSHQIVIEPTLLAYYKSLPWRGNYREIKNHLERKRKMNTLKNHFIYDDIDEGLELSAHFSIDLKWEDYVSSICSMDDFKRKYAQIIFNRLNRDLQKTSNLLQVSSKTLKILLEL